MPELPEVETIRRDLEKSLQGRLITDFKVNDRRLMLLAEEARWRTNALNQPIESIARRGKYLVLKLKHRWSIIFHLRMTGQLVLGLQAPETKIRFELRFDDSQTLAFIDQRRFGEVWLLAPDQAWPSKSDLGPDALNELKEQAFVDILKKRSTKIQPILMDQRVISGVGNIYAQEALFKALIRPSRPGMRVTRREALRLFSALQETLQSAIEHRGSTSRNYRDAFGQSGDAQSLHSVYRKGGKPCPRCGNRLVSARVGGRGTVFCRKCQR